MLMEPFINRGAGGMSLKVRPAGLQDVMEPKDGCSSRCPPQGSDEFVVNCNHFMELAGKNG